MKTRVDDLQPVHLMSFTELLDEYLELKETGPDEDDGYTDKGYYDRLDMLRSQMNSRVDR